MIKTNFKLNLTSYIISVYIILWYILLRLRIFILRIIKEFKYDKIDNNYENFEKTHKSIVLAKDYFCIMIYIFIFVLFLNFYPVYK